MSRVVFVFMKRHFDHINHVVSTILHWNLNLRYHTDTHPNIFHHSALAIETMKNIKLVEIHKNVISTYLPL